MRKLVLFLTLVFFTTSYSLLAQNEANKEEIQIEDTDKVEIFYFHNTRRCATCEAVEQVTLETLESKYSKQMKQGVLVFQSLNIEEDVNEPLARRLGVSGQTLLVVKADKKIDLTNEAFMYARTKPDKLKNKIIKAIDGL